MRCKIIAGNWKMNNGPKQTYEFVRQIEEWLAIEGTVCEQVVDGNMEIVVFPPAVSLHAANHLAHASCVQIGGQNVHWEVAGAFTGEISASMLIEESCAYCLVGHSERRHLFHETNEQTAQKVHSLFNAGLTPILCVGELLSERESQQTNEVVKAQLLEGIKEISSVTNVDRRLVIAYEPVWAIGTGKTATPQDAQEVCHYIRDLVEKQFGADCAKKMRILYGGSVTAANTRALLAEPDVDGVLIGGASVKAASFQDILVEAAK